MRTFANDGGLFAVRRDLRRSVAEQEVQEHPALLLSAIHLARTPVVFILYTVFLNRYCRHPPTALWN